MPSLSRQLNPKSDLHRKIVTGIQDRILASKNTFNSKYEQWSKNEDSALAFIPEKDVDAIRRVKRDQEGVPQYTTLYVPYTYGILMTSHTYWTTVFLSRNPVLQFAGRHGETEQQTQALEALMAYNVDVGQALVPWYIWLYDVGKYGVGVLGTYWAEEFSIISSIDEIDDMFLGMIPTGAKKRVKVNRRVKGYEGNKNYNVRPFDFFPDPRVTFANFQQGEFVGVFRKIGWNEVLKRADQGYYINLDMIKPTKSFNSADNGEQGSSRIERPGETMASGPLFTDPTKGTKSNSQGNSTISCYEFYINLIPSDWGVGSGELPEKWVFTVTSDFKTIFGAMPLGANHDKFPFNVLTYEPEGYGIVPRGQPEILKPIQDTVNWLINSHFYSVRKILNGQYIVDPSRVNISDMLDPQHGGIIRLKPAGYGSIPSETVQQLTAMDVTRTHLQDIQVMYEMGMRAVGVNDQLMGVLQGSGRKTATEVRSASTFGINRLKTNAEFFSAMGFAPMSQMMVQNAQQYYDAEMKFKLVGDLAQMAGPQFIDVNPDLITGFYDFVPVDGTLPIDRFAQANLWKEIMLAMQRLPQIAMEYDIGKIFAWTAQLGGLKNISQFKIQMGSPAWLQQQAQMGNMVPLGGAANGAPPAAAANMAEPKQIGGVGPTG
jgi:hypothetical protein